MRAAYNFARWLVGNEHDAEDVVQDSFTKAFQAIDGFRGGDCRTWLLAIVRNTALNSIRSRRTHEVAWNEKAPEPVDAAPDPEAGLLRNSDRTRVRSAIEKLPDEFRETLVLREIEGLPYKEIAFVLKVPVGTVMSRLSRARKLLIQELNIEKESRL